jgi:dipeptidyl-peptidase 4
VTAMRPARRPTVLLLALAAAAVCLSTAGTAQGLRPLTLDAIYGPEGRVDFSGAPETTLTWIDDESYRVARQTGRGVQWVRVDAATGTAAALLDQDRMEAALRALPDVTAGQAAAAAWSSPPALDTARTGALLTIAGDLYYYDMAAGSARRLTSGAAHPEEALFSPDGRLVAFVRANDLHVVDLAAGTERRITYDGSEAILNGKLDWLYQEEIYGRGRFRAFWWSPDSTRLAFLRLDQSAVPTTPIVDHIAYHPPLEVMRYPRAGDPNPGVRLGVAGARGSDPLRWIDLSAYDEADVLIVNVDWSPDSRQVAYQVQDREQRWLDLRMSDVVSGRDERLLRETSPAWVSPLGSPTWLRDGSFLWLSERTGFRHVYRYAADGSLQHPVTGGRWDVRTLHGVDERDGWLYFAADEQTPIGLDVYRIRLDGASLTRLSAGGGTHRATFNPGFTQYVGLHSRITTPTQVRLHRADGSELRVIDANRVRALEEYRLSPPEFVQLEARDGYPLNGLLIRPPDFDPARRYPVYQFTYGGPGAAQVRDTWGATQYLFHQLLAQHGFIVWVLDNRSAGGRGVEAQWPIYGRLGERELEDLEDGAAWLAHQAYVDPSRLVLSGWSYGGFLAAYALTHSTRWSAGIAGAPVTDWRDYDTVYTERYMQTPQRNPGGYARTAPARAAAQLQGRLLLIHGTLDDNVHVQSTLKLAYELQRAGRPFELMLYPRSRHGISDPSLNRHVRQLMLDFALRATTPTGPAPAH